MESKKAKLIKLPRSQRLRDRAVFCKRLAVGAGDPDFATKLLALAEEYEGEAARSQGQVETHSDAEDSREPNFRSRVR